MFHALRASCESDLAREYPITTVCTWIGNTVAIAARHYVQVTDQDFERASVLRDIHNLAKKAVAKLEKKKLARAK